MERMPSPLDPLKYGSPHPQGPAAIVTRRSADRLRSGSVWVYRSEVEQLLPAENEKAIPPGALVTVLLPDHAAPGLSRFRTHPRAVPRADRRTRRAISASA
jgi:hypothetical protein